MVKILTEHRDYLAPNFDLTTIPKFDEVQQNPLLVWPQNEPTIGESMYFHAQCRGNFVWASRPQYHPELVIMAAHLARGYHTTLYQIIATFLADAWDNHPAEVNWQPTHVLDFSQAKAALITVRELMHRLMFETRIENFFCHYNWGEPIVLVQAISWQLIVNGRVHLDLPQAPDYLDQLATDKKWQIERAKKAEQIRQLQQRRGGEPVIKIHWIETAEQFKEMFKEDADLEKFPTKPKPTKKLRPMKARSLHYCENAYDPGYVRKWGDVEYKQVGGKAILKQSNTDGLQGKSGFYEDD